MTKNACALGLYSYSTPNPGADGFKRFYDLFMLIFENIGIKPTYFAADGVGFNGDLTKIGGKAHAKALKENFDGIHVLSLVANPDGSVEPGYDSFASVSLSYVKEMGETLLCFAIDEKYIEFGGKIFETIAKQLAEAMAWDYGFAISQPIEKKPEFHVLGLDGGNINKEERRRLNEWYASLPEDRVKKIRDVYALNFLNAVQLSARVSEGRTLKEFIIDDSDSTLEPLNDGKLWLWRLPEGGLEMVREKIRLSGILIS